jgi:excisionase family DNA binding protein
LDEVTIKALAEQIALAIKESMALQVDDSSEKRDARLRASQNAIFAGQKPPKEQCLLIDTKAASRLLGVSDRTIFTMSTTGKMPPPIRIGRAVRFSAEALRKWVEAGCPPMASGKS